MFGLCHGEEQLYVSKPFPFLIVPLTDLIVVGCFGSIDFINYKEIPIILL